MEPDLEDRRCWHKALMKDNDGCVTSVYCELDQGHPGAHRCSWPNFTRRVGERWDYTIEESVPWEWTDDERTPQPTEGMPLQL